MVRPDPLEGEHHGDAPALSGLKVQVVKLLSDREIHVPIGKGHQLGDRWQIGPLQSLGAKPVVQLEVAGLGVEGEVAEVHGAAQSGNVPPPQEDDPVGTDPAPFLFPEGAADVHLDGVHDVE